jgi:integrase
MLSAAVEDEILQANPAHGLRLPRVDPKPPFFWTKEEAGGIVATLRTRRGVRVATMVDLDMHVGLRWGELAGLKARYVSPDAGRSGLIQVAGVQTRHGWRPWPKSKMSRRAVPIPPHLQEPMREFVAGLDPDALVFPAPSGGAWHDTNFRKRIFAPAITEAGVRRGTPHDMRHTAASWLVQSGVALYRVQALLGHESITTTQRYSHLAPDEFDEITDAWT